MLQAFKLIIWINEIVVICYLVFLKEENKFVIVPFQLKWASFHSFNGEFFLCKTFIEVKTYIFLFRNIYLYRYVNLQLHNNF